jgi:hypothetical protein
VDPAVTCGRKPHSPILTFPNVVAIDRQNADERGVEEASAEYIQVNCWYVAGRSLSVGTLAVYRFHMDS